jgi:hypothetical protein
MSVRRVEIFAICSVYLLSDPGEVFGYIDPATGSFVLQSLIAGVLGAAVTIRIFWRRIISGLHAMWAHRRASVGSGASGAEKPETRRVNAGSANDN